MRGGVFRNAEIAHLAANLLVRVIGMQQSVEQELKLVVENGQTGFGVEVIASAPLHREGVGLRERHGLAGGERAAHIAFSHEQVFLRVWLAAVRNRKSVDPRECLRDGLHLNEIEREAGFLVDEARAEGLAGVVEVEGGSTEAAGRGLLGDVAE